MTERVRAIIVHDGKIALMKRTTPAGIFWVFPGGAVEPGEGHAAAVIRESKEELGLDVQPGELLIERLSDKPKTRGQKEYYYWATMIGGELGTGTGPEYQPNSHYVGQHDPEWVDILALGDLHFFPSDVRDLVLQKPDQKK